MKSGIYKLTWPNTPYYYIGSSKDINYRFRQHISAIGRKDNTFNIQIVANKFGNPVLNILELCDINILIDRECHYISLYTDKDNCLNKNKPGQILVRAHSESLFLMLLNQ